MILSSVTKLVVYLVVAGSAQTHEVIVSMSATFGYWQNMMHLFSRSHPSLGIAPFTIGVRCIVPITDAFPCASVFFMHIRCALVLVILSPFLYAVFLAVLSVCKVGAAGI